MAATAGNNCVKHISVLRKDLEQFSNSAPTTNASIRGQIMTTLTALSSELDRMEGLIKGETNVTKREKSTARNKDLRAQYSELKVSYEQLGRRRDDEVAAQSRQELLGRRPTHNATPENPYANAGQEREQQSRQQGNLNEASALNRMGNTLDEYIESGLASLGDLRDQSTALKGTQKRLRDIAVGLGLSGDTIRLIERRTKGDKWIFYGGCLFTLICFYFILKWFG
ncbi:protein of unknown function [Taphrina deformans PYCC 5710]|uniref:Protein transport protein BOS1 n=1 Tax=Taphrina deformans (strain PYCC 5710 / ATCC 11124 / CBS 356.35 / IMI 108563 / JCM 9778 / NBRC 8474) TaxID=1097556 RepID=R4XGD8_TAPDE|nr:protein of unknown function [Taphrina deformans PYCC 5710]|eukprot:CCG84702.1 protein of unknown function [Taphrina deformans PYCC 5710]